MERVDPITELGKILVWCLEWRWTCMALRSPLEPSSSWTRRDRLPCGLGPNQPYANIDANLADDR